MGERQKLAAHWMRQDAISSGDEPAPTVQPHEGDLVAGWQEFNNPQLEAQLVAQGFSKSAASALCGPIAAAALARAYGISTDPATLARYAADHGLWSPDMGMLSGDGSGIQQLLGSLGLDATNRPASDLQGLVVAVQSGKPVVLNFPSHYMLAQGVRQRQDGQTEFYVGVTGSNALRGGSDWMTLEEMAGNAGNGGALESYIAPSGDLGAAAAGHTPDNTYAPASATARPEEVESYIRQSAQRRGIDPDVAVRIAQSEGGFEPNREGVFATGHSFGPFQLHYGGKGYEHFGTTAGMGNAFTAETGYQPGDPAAWKASVDYALNAAARDKSWAAWYGRGPAGVAVHEGFQDWSSPVASGHSADAGAATSYRDPAQMRDQGTSPTPGLTALGTAPTLQNGRPLLTDNAEADMQAFLDWRQRERQSQARDSASAPADPFAGVVSDGSGSVDPQGNILPSLTPRQRQEAQQAISDTLPTDTGLTPRGNEIAGALPDALGALAGQAVDTVRRGVDTVLTPHPDAIAAALSRATNDPAALALSPVASGHSAEQSQDYANAWYQAAVNRNFTPLGTIIARQVSEGRVPIPVPFLGETQSVLHTGPSTPVDPEVEAGFRQTIASHLEWTPQQQQAFLDSARGAHSAAMMMGLTGPINAAGAAATSAARGAGSTFDVLVNGRPVPNAAPAPPVIMGPGPTPRIDSILGAEDTRAAIRPGLSDTIARADEALINRFSRVWWKLDQAGQDAIRNVGGADARTSAAMETTLRPILRAIADVPEGLQNLNRYMVAAQVPELEARGFRVERGLTSAQAAAEMDALRQRIGPEAFQKVEDAAQQLYRWQEQNTLRYAVKSGLVNADRADQWVAENPNYFPHRVLDHEMERNFGAGSGQGLSVSDSGFTARKGSELDIRQPLDAIVQRSYAVRRIADRNEAANAIVDGLQRLHPEVIQRLASVDAKVSAGFDKISRMVNGTREAFAVPTEIAVAVKQLDVERANTWVRLFGALNAPSRVAYTVASPSFLLRNVTRDVFDRFYRRGRLPDLDYLRGVFAALTRNGDWEAFMREGGGLSSLTEHLAPRKTVNELSKSGLLRAAETIVNPFKLMQRINEIAEVGPKIGDFVHDVKGGMAPRQAAMRARGATVDYWMGGTLTKAANPLVMFLNANIQALYNTAEPLLVGTPKQRLAAGARLAFLGTALEAAHQWNMDKTYQGGPKDGKSLLDDVPQYDRDYNMVLVLGQTQNEQGENVPFYIRVPKPSVMVPVSIIMQSMLDWAAGHPSRSALDTAQSVITGVSPIAPADVGGSLLPPLLSVPGDIRSNYSPFRNAPVESDRIHSLPRAERDMPGTTETAKILANQKVPGLGQSLGEVFNLSPVQTDYLGRGMFGGTYDAIAYAADRGLAAVGLGPPIPDSGQGTQLARFPFTKGILAARGGQQDQNLLRDYRARYAQAEAAALETLRQTPEYQQATTEERDKLVASMQRQLQDQMQQAAGDTLPSYMQDVPDGHPPKWNVNVLPKDMRPKYENHLDHLEADMNEAARVVEAYNRDPKDNPKPTKDQFNLAFINGHARWTNPEWQRWQADQRTKQDRSRNVIRGTLQQVPAN